MATAPYLVVHKDPARGAAIVAALGGEGSARLASDLYAASSLAKELGRPPALLVATDGVDDLVVDRVAATPGLRDVPVLYDGGATGPVYRAFVQQWRLGRPFHHRAAATPEEAARALVRVASAPVPPRWPLVLRIAVLVGLMVLMAVQWVAPELLPGPLGALFRFGATPLAMGLLFVLPALAAMSRGIRPSKGAVAWTVFLALQVVTAVSRATRWPG